MQNTFYSSLKHITLQIVIAYRFLCAFLLLLLVPAPFCRPQNSFLVAVALFLVAIRKRPQSAMNGQANERKGRTAKRERGREAIKNHRNLFFACAFSSARNSYKSHSITYVCIMARIEYDIVSSHEKLHSQ